MTERRGLKTSHPFSAQAGNAARLRKVVRTHESLLLALGEAPPADVAEAAALADDEVMATCGEALKRHAAVLEDRARDDLAPDWHKTDETYNMITSRRVDPAHVLSVARSTSDALALLVTCDCPGAKVGFETRVVTVRAPDDDALYGLEVGFQILIDDRRERLQAEERALLRADPPPPALGKCETERASAHRPRFFDPAYGFQ